MRIFIYDFLPWFATAFIGGFAGGFFACLCAFWSISS